MSIPPHRRPGFRLNKNSRGYRFRPRTVIFLLTVVTPPLASPQPPAPPPAECPSRGRSTETASLGSSSSRSPSRGRSTETASLGSRIRSRSTAGTSVSIMGGQGVFLCHRRGCLRLSILGAEKRLR